MGIDQGSGSGWTNDSDVTLAESAASASGPTPDDMAVWTESRQVQLDAFGEAEEDHSKYGIPKGLVETSANPWGGNYTEKGLGATLEGGALGPDGTPIPGTISLVDVDAGETLGNGTVNGTFIGSAGVLDAVTDGGDVPGGVPDNLRWEFTPIMDAMPSTRDSVQYPHTTGFSARYGHVIGSVTTWDGTPVPDANVFHTGSIASTTTDGDGEYSIAAPGGKSVELEALKGSAKDQVFVTEFDSTRLDFQYPAAEVKVVGPKGEPAIGIPVTINESTLRTGGDGVALFDVLPLGNYEATIMGNVTEGISVTSQGMLDQTVYQGGSRVDIIVEDYEIGDPIQDIVAIEKEDGYVSYSGDTGVISVVFVGGGEFKLEVAPMSNRYTKKVINVGVGEDEVQEIKSQLQRDIATTNR